MARFYSRHDAEKAQARPIRTVHENRAGTEDLVVECTTFSKVS